MTPPADTSRPNPAEKGPRSRRRLWAFRLLASGVPVLLGAVAAAVLFRTREFHNPIEPGPIYVQEPGYERTGHRYLYDPLLGWKNIPSWQATTRGKKLTINSRGLRGREYPYKKAPGVTRILVLGDSYIWGYGVADQEVLTEVLEERLGGAAGRYEVLNAGVSGWGNDQEYLWLKNEGFRYSPDLVVLAFFIINDPTNNSYSRQYGLQKPVFMDLLLTLRNVPVPKPGTGAAVLETRASPIELTIAIMQAMARECANHQCRFVVMKFGNFLRLNDPRWVGVAERFRDAVRDCLGLPYLDLDAEYNSRGIAAGEMLEGNDDDHWNAHGHQVSAAILHDFLVNHKLVQ
jgi:lysophospholipase L1-like esterase